MNPPPIGINRTTEYLAAETFQEFLSSVTANDTLWAAVSRRSRVPDDIALRALRIRGSWHLLVLLEDWCADAVNTVPVLARLADEVPGLSLRVLRRDDNPALMDQHLISGSRAIPVVMILDDRFDEVAWWGPRPHQLQDWRASVGVHLPGTERYREMRRWYAVDRGRSALEEVLRLLCDVSGADAGCAAA